MNRTAVKQIIVYLIMVVWTTSAFPCTTFTIKDKHGNIVFGRNFDFPAGAGHVCINKRNMRKTAFIRPPEKPMVWISKYGSITFNQSGKEFPYGGMNEAGLVIEQMWLQEAKYPEMDNRYGLSELQWIQYQLDNARTVQEVIDSDTLVRVSFTSTAPLHFLVTDVTGDVATIEYIEGKLICHRGDDLPYPVLANCTYDMSMRYKSHLDNKTEESFADWTLNSSGRFSKAASMIENYNEDVDIIEYAFDIMDNVAQGTATQWSIAYDIKNKKIYYKTNANKSIRQIEMKQFNFACDQKDLYMDIDTHFKTIDEFKPYGYETNLQLIHAVFDNVDFLKNIPNEVRESIARYPESVNCVEE